MILRYQPVRTSTLLSKSFILAMGSSPGFGSFTSDQFALLTLGFPTGPSSRTYPTACKNSLDHSSIGTPSPDSLATGRLRLFVGVWFQFYFTPLTGVLFTFPSRYLFTIDHQKYLALDRSRPGFAMDSLLHGYSGNNSVV